MVALETETCRFPGCERPVEAAAETVGRPPRYCELPEHNAQTAFRERRRRAASGELAGDDADRAGGDRPVSLAIASIGSLAKRLADDMARTRELLSVLTDTEQLKAELAAVRADAKPRSQAPPNTRPTPAASGSRPPKPPKRRSRVAGKV